MIGAEFKPYRQQRISDTLLCSVETPVMQSEFNAAVALAVLAEKTTFYSWRSKVAIIFEVKGNQRRAVCCYEWHKYPGLCVSTNGKSTRHSWISFQQSVGLQLSLKVLPLVSKTMTPKKKQKSLCTRWGRGQLGRNGVLDEEDVEGDDMEESGAADANRNDRRCI